MFFFSTTYLYYYILSSSNFLQTNVPLGSLHFPTMFYHFPYHFTTLQRWFTMQRWYEMMLQSAAQFLEGQILPTHTCSQAPCACTQWSKSGGDSFGANDTWQQIHQLMVENGYTGIPWYIVYTISIHSMFFHGLFENGYTMAYTTDLLFTAERILTKGAAISCFWMVKRCLKK